MSQETPSNNNSLALADAILAVSRGDLAHRVLAAFSDLDREKIGQLRRAWPLIETEQRARLIRALDELAEESVSYNFSRDYRLALEDDNPGIRQLAIPALWEEESSELLDLLLGMIDDESQDVRAEAARALGHFAVLAAGGELDDDTSERIYDSLLRLTSSDDEPQLVRRFALESLASFGRRSPVPDLIRAAYADEDQSTRAGALFAMGRTLDTRWLNIVMSELTADDPELRYEAARACGELGDNRAVEGLAPLTADPDLEVRLAAITALGKIASPGASRVLRRLAERASGDELQAIEEAMEQTELLSSS
jgi:HEAT repeat protein